MSSTIKRGLVHIFGGLSIPIAALFLPRVALLISLGVAIFIFLAFELLRFKLLGVNSWFLRYFRPLLRQEEASRITGASYIVIASLIAFLAFPRDIAVMALSFLAVGDAVAAIVGRYMGKRRLLGKTLEGSLACLISCITTGFIFYCAGLNVGLLTIFLGSITATITEALPLPINDNLTMPLLAGVVMAVIQL
jgi:glycerol-3-phosphate acyltransferase PlsY